MSDAATPAYTISQNVRWFTIVYIFGVLICGVAVSALQSMRVALPAAGLSIGLYAAIVYVAGHRYAKWHKFAWTGKDRHLLAFGYVVVAVVASSFVFLALTMLSPTSFAIVSPGIFGFSAVVVVVMTLAYYVMARLMLRLVARQGGNK